MSRPRCARAAAPRFEYDLALPATKCDAEMATVRLPSKIVLLPSCVRDATLHVIRVEADIRQWKLAGKALKRIRSSCRRRGGAAAPARRRGRGGGRGVTRGFLSKSCEMRVLQGSHLATETRRVRIGALSLAPSSTSHPFPHSTATRLNRPCR